jgi:hypothetical protein
MLSQQQVELFNKTKPQELYPEFYLIKAGDFNEDNVNDTLDEWVYFLKTGNVKDSFKAQGLDKAKQKLEVAKLPPKKRAAYERDTKHLHSEASWAETQAKKEQDLIRDTKRKAEYEKAVNMAEKAIEKGYPIDDIVEISGLSKEQVLQIKDRMSK